MTWMRNAGFADGQPVRFEERSIYTRIIKLLKAVAMHRYCEDGFYACPKSAESFGHEGQPCNCNGDEAQAILDDLAKGGW